MISDPIIPRIVEFAPPRCFAGLVDCSVMTAGSRTFNLVLDSKINQFLHLSCPISYHDGHWRSRPGFGYPGSNRSYPHSFVGFALRTCIVIGKAVTAVIQACLGHSWTFVGFFDLWDFYRLDWTYVRVVCLESVKVK